MTEPTVMSGDKRDAEARPERVADSGGAPRRRARARGDRSRRAVWFLRYGTLAAFVLVILFFTISLPGTYLTWDTIRASWTFAVPMLLIAAVLTMPLRVGDFDLSIGYQAQLYSGIAVVLMSKGGMGSLESIIITVAIALGIGTAIGLVVAYSGVSAFVVTLAVGIMLFGAEIAVSGNQQISEGISSGFLAIANNSILSVPIPIIIAVVALGILWVLQDRTVWGRNVAAVGSSQEAARLSGIRVELVRAGAFSLVGVGCALAGVILAAQAQAYYPNSATGLLLPAYAACFLGATILRPGTFHVLGTAIGVLFLQAVQTGIVQMNYSAAVANIVQGSILILAVLTSQLGRRITR